MLRLFFSLAVVFVFSFASPAFAAPAPKDDGFAAMLVKFRAAVAAKDKNAVADLTDFGAFFWDSDDSLRNVKTRADFMKNYDKMFTAEIRHRVATVAPDEDKSGSHHLHWIADDMEYDLYFPPRKDGTWLLQGLSASPY
jgi:hypothetical protein